MARMTLVWSYFFPGMKQSRGGPFSPGRRDGAAFRSPVQFGDQPVQIQRVAVGYILQRLEQRLAANADAGLAIPLLEDRLGCTVAADNVQNRHTGRNVTRCFVAHFSLSPNHLELQTNRDGRENQIDITDVSVGKN